MAQAKSEFAGPAVELDAENLFLLGKYPEPAKVYCVAVEPGRRTRTRRLNFAFRLGQCAYHGGDYARAVEILQPIVGEPEGGGRTRRSAGRFSCWATRCCSRRSTPKPPPPCQVRAGRPKADKQEAQFKLGLAQLNADQRPPPSRTSAAAAGRRTRLDDAGDVRVGPVGLQAEAAAARQGGGA